MLHHYYNEFPVWLFLMYITFSCKHVFQKYIMPTSSVPNSKLPFKKELSVLRGGHLYVLQSTVENEKIQKLSWKDSLY